MNKKINTQVSKINTQVPIDLINFLLNPLYMQNIKNYFN